MPEPSIHLAPDAPTPIYRQIVDQIRLHIDQQTLAAGDPLPSVRSLATQLGVHFNTVAEAYRELADEGLLDLNQGRRATIRTPGSPRPLPKAEAETLRHALRHLVAEMRLKGVPATTILREVASVLER